ncbi:MAG: TrmH family RNA methyltransferase [Patescibacteria group bacterium]|nr:TrmH family RNA methyltransferase [Patescibacteria group bacterium]MDE2116728.1 TrmH family RNA methyltransferase [Patescibacteria group bacterium]
MKKNASRDIRILLHDLRSVHNVGAIFRTADAIGASRIYLSGYTPTPIDRFGRPRADLAKAALGAEKTLAWEHVASPSRLFASLKKEGFEIIAVEQSDGSIDYKKARPARKALVIFGNEVSGIRQAMLRRADATIEIPMRGKKESLNVSVSAGIVLFRLFD